MALLCLGGSFNPIHHGHLLIARAVAEQANFDGILLIPSAQPPHKSNVASLASTAHRLAMCRLAVQGDPFFHVSDIETHRTGPSYTIDTVRELKRGGWSAVTWLIGADMVANLPQWHEPLALLSETQFLIANRPGWTLDWQKLPPEYQFLQRQVVPVPQIEISATTIRARIAAGRSVAYMTPESVMGYIRENGLYRGASGS